MDMIAWECMNRYMTFVACSYNWMLEIVCKLALWVPLGAWVKIRKDHCHHFLCHLINLMAWEPSLTWASILKCFFDSQVVHSRLSQIGELPHIGILLCLLAIFCKPISFIRLYWWAGINAILMTAHDKYNLHGTGQSIFENLTKLEAAFSVYVFFWSSHYEQPVQDIHVLKYLYLQIVAYAQSQICFGHDLHIQWRDPHCGESCAVFPSNLADFKAAGVNYLDEIFDIQHAPQILLAF